jgi:hypothetical protein
VSVTLGDIAVVAAGEDQDQRRHRQDHGRGDRVADDQPLAVGSRPVAFALEPPLALLLPLILVGHRWSRSLVS